MQFTINPSRIKVIFGAPVAGQLADELAALDAKRAMIVCTPSAQTRAQPLADALGDACAGFFDQVVTHVPQEVVAAAQDEFNALDADSLITFGGGSSIDTGKALAAQTGAPIIAIPTTYSGAEMTANYGVVIDGQKTPHRDERAFARAVIYDPELTTGLSPHMSATSGMNALAHCVEALYPEVPNPVASMMAEEGVRALTAGLPAAVADPDNMAARTQALYGAYLGGAVVTLVGIALHHRTSQLIGGRYGIAHGDTNSVILPQATAYNAPAAREAMQRLGEALGSDDPAAAIFDFAQSIGAPTDLSSLGMNEADLDEAAERAIANTAYNPRPLELGPVREMLQDAFDGNRPSVPL